MTGWKVLVGRFLVLIWCMFFGFYGGIDISDAAADDGAFPTGADTGGPDLVINSVTGPASAYLGQSVQVKWTVKNRGDIDASTFKVGLYLSTDNKIEPAKDRLLKKVDPGGP